MTKAQLKRRLRKIISFFRRIGLKNTDFTIISNNCWGGAVYDTFGLKYLTPTIGLWFTSEDYIKFISNLDFYLKQTLIQISYKDSNAVDLLTERKKQGKYKFSLDDMIIGRLYDIDIIFLHYKTFGEAFEKWNRRKKRINYKKLLVKFNDQNGFTLKNYYAFKSLPYIHKVFITARPDLKNEENVIYIDYADETGSIFDDTNKLKECNIKRLVNNL